MIVLGSVATGIAAAGAGAKPNIISASPKSETTSLSTCRRYYTIYKLESSSAFTKLIYVILDGESCYIDWI